MCYRNLVVTEGISAKCSVYGKSQEGGVLFPLMKCLVVDRLICNLKKEGYYTQAHADDIVILLREIHLEVLIQWTQEALRIVRQWCKSTHLSVNTVKTECVVVTRRQ